MGNRVKGRPKKSSIKAALSSAAGSQRKLSRMGKKQKKEHSGLEATFIGRSQCIKMLQVSIKDFRRLCILKGIYPREPLGRVPGKKKGQTFYHIKDIRAIAHEPILERFRDIQSFMKKIRRAAGRNEREEALRRNSVMPTYTLHHLVKERYPRFVDALSDLDDALTLTYLFAALPNDREIQAKHINKAKRLAAAWGAYCATTSAITKSFISIKGVYMEASIQGVDIRWIVPHAFTQFLPDDVDFRVMNTFLEFFETMLNFVLYKLYNDIGIRYPFTVQELGGQVVGSTSVLLGSNLRALTNALNATSSAISNVVSLAVEKKMTELKDEALVPKIDKDKCTELVKSVGAALNRLRGDDSDDYDDSDNENVDVAGPLQAALESVANEEARASIPTGTDGVDDEVLKRKRLFQGITFFFSREIPRGYLELVCLAYGAKIGWENDDSPISMKDPTITHHVVDRPLLPVGYESLPKSRDYIQPQWILDCANFRFILPIARYAVGATLPPHLSPWVNDEEEGYKPKYAEEIERLKNGETVDQANEDMDTERVDDNMDETPFTAPTEDIENPIDQEESVDDDEGEEEDDDVVKARRERKRKLEEEETHKLAKSMMNRKAAHLYGRMQHGIARREAKVDALHQRRKELETGTGLVGNDGRLELKGKEKDSSGKTPGMQKVERLKSERKSVEDAYSKTGGTMKKSKNNKVKKVR